ncbi:stage II sporulation protein R [Radiobacillus sp. PE A8.2]|uniref:stage II sporulation protein R n=1 Tax=Radiobacillus sp. PE A8.2 TaxID=3380349 RepID=UPI00388F9069
MKKLGILLILFILFFTAFPVQGLGIGEQSESEASVYQVIPDEAIRLRILANSDSERDQQLKRSIRDSVNAEINTWVRDITDIENARQLIQDKLPEIEQIVAEELEDRGVEQSYQVEYDSDISFPTKIYDTYIYPAGDYEAILISLGEGKGANWWCVLFPPLCFLDFSSGTSVAEQEEEQQSDEQQQNTMADSNPLEEDEEEEVEVKFFFLSWFS